MSDEFDRSVAREAARQSGLADQQAETAGRIDHSTDVLERVSAELHEERFWRKRQRRQSRLNRVLAAIVLLGLGWVARINLSNGEAVRDCTTPHHECYERGQKQGAAFAKAIVICSRRPAATDADALACVAEQLRP